MLSSFSLSPQGLQSQVPQLIKSSHHRQKTIEEEFSRDFLCLFLFSVEICISEKEGKIHLYFTANVNKTV